jgi:hypothetical protein
VTPPPTWLYFPAAPLWQPSDLGSLRAWYKADALSLSNNDPVSSWTDSSGGGYTLSASSGDRPTFKTSTLNSLPVVEYSGSNWLTAATASDWTFLHNSTGSSVFMVVKAGTSSDPNAVYALLGNNAGTSANHGFSVFWDDRVSVPRNEVVVLIIARGVLNIENATVNNVSSDGAMAPNVAQVLGVVSDPANGTAANRSSIRVNGGTAIANNTLTNAASTNNPTFNFQIGANGNNAVPLTGYIAEVVICNAKLSDSNRERVEGYLAWKWGLQGNLAAGHPYLNAAPTNP